MVPPRVHVVVIPDTLRRTTAGVVSGQLWLHADDGDRSATAYPAPGWWDFPAPVLTWWLDAVTRLPEGRAASCRFMDGPHAFTVEAAGEHLRVHTDEWSSPVIRADLEASLRAAAGAVLAECERQGWSSRDILDLRRATGGAGRDRAR